jgi:hypothetical protein
VAGASGAVSYTTILNNGNLARHALKTQAYFDDDIIVINEQSSSLDCLESAINNCLDEQAKDIVIYMVGNGNSNDFSLTSSETLSKAYFKQLLSVLQIPLYD